MHFLRDWLVKHIQGSDQAYRPHLNAKGDRKPRKSTHNRVLLALFGHCR